MFRLICVCILSLIPAWPCALQAKESTCHGTVANGRLEDGVRLPAEGRNFSAYSALGVSLGRTYVHSTVADIVTQAYQQLEQTVPDKVFVYGETGWQKGGRMKPHRTHRNGLSVDFMMPLINGQGISRPLPGSIDNKFGYDIDFDAQGRYGDYHIDVAALAEHLFQLDLAAKAKGRELALVIIDPPYLTKLFTTKRGSYLQAHMKFMKEKAWIRHDEHYHVDFDIPCKKN
ncbi:penicillin-insensitive murein endopeptidase [Undibacterium sp. TS12]|uniref:penicillin-insensitive murein endopeptidase n=1 Tax=Undibacterium sp. TS12 TaxID=2908202 RepID=UPI001F4CDFE4|nr:penicillin-insensitive murein endopeptidase [Undibacterium sp. TS12]MCH8620820.1 penicillin-insensitive murein endopeptidase [Undibacterium sp. TS12]